MSIKQGIVELASFINWLKGLPDEEMFWQPSATAATTSPIAMYIMRKNKPRCEHCKAENPRNVYVRVDQWGYTTLNEHGQYTNYTLLPKWVWDVHQELSAGTRPAEVLAILDAHGLVKQKKEKKKAPEGASPNEQSSS